MSSNIYEKINQKLAHINRCNAVQTFIFFGVSVFQFPHKFRACKCEHYLWMHIYNVYAINDSRYLRAVAIVVVVSLYFHVAYMLSDLVSQQNHAEQRKREKRQ